MCLSMKAVSSGPQQEIHNYSWTIESFEQVVNQNLVGRLKSKDIDLFPNCCRVRFSIVRSEEYIKGRRPELKQPYSVYCITAECVYPEQNQNPNYRQRVINHQHDDEALKDLGNTDFKAHLLFNHSFKNSSLLMWLIGPEGRKICVKKGETLDKIDFSFQQLDRIGTTNEFDFLCNGSLEFRIEMQLTKMTHGGDKFVKPLPQKDLPLNLGDLLKKGLLSDFTIQTLDEQIKVHRCILVARSAVFASMMEADMKEKSDNTVKLTQYDPGVVKKFVEFIYTDELVFAEDKTGQDSDICIQLLELAHVYFMPRLKALCEIHLIKNMSANNIFDILKASDRYDADDLLTNAMKFFRLNKSNMIQRDALVGLLQFSSQRLSDEILASLSSMQQ